jgi:dipeptidyl aminopeptidase/acylaminoacyl peptidase
MEGRRVVGRAVSRSPGAPVVLGVLAVTLCASVSACDNEGDAPSATRRPSASQQTTADATTALDVAASRPTTVAAPPTTVAVAPPGGTIAYSAEVDGNVDVFIVQPGDQPVRLTTDEAEEFDPDLSPDGQQIVYRRNPDSGSDHADIWTMDRDGGSRRNLTQAPELSNWSPAWTPDGRIVFASMRDGSAALELWIMHADGGRASRVGAGWCEYPSASPDGTSYVCSASVGGRYDLVIVTEEGVRTPLTATPDTEFGASWSPDGEWISFSRDFGERWELRRIRPDGTGEEVIASEGVFSTWTPDGRLAWSGPGGINVADADGTNPTRIDLVADFISWGL